MAQWPSPRPTGRRPERPLPPPSVQTQVHPSCSPTAFTAMVAVMSAVTVTAVTALHQQQRSTLLRMQLPFSNLPNYPKLSSTLLDRSTQAARSGCWLEVPGQ